MTGYLWRGRPDLERLNALIMELRGDREVPVHAFDWANADNNTKYYKPRWMRPSAQPKGDRDGKTTAA